ARGAGLIDRIGTAGEDDAAWPEGPEPLDRHIERHDLAVDVELTDAARDQLTVLGAEIEDQNGLPSALRSAARHAAPPARRPTRWMRRSKACSGFRAPMPFSSRSARRQSA